MVLSLQADATSWLARILVFAPNSERYAVLWIADFECEDLRLRVNFHASDRWTSCTNKSVDEAVVEDSVGQAGENASARFRWKAPHVQYLAPS
jgi:hypothetical protein